MQSHYENGLPNPKPSPSFPRKRESSDFVRRSYGKNLQTPLGPRCSLPSNAFIGGDGDKFFSARAPKRCVDPSCSGLKNLRSYDKFKIDPVAVRNISP